jgi:hypothetical protein
VKRGTLAVALALLVAGCRPAATGPPESDPLDEARRLVEERRFDEALGRLGESGDAETLYLLGRAWAGKAETAPLPMPDRSGGPRLKAEEERALEFLEQAVATRPDHASAHLAIARVLAPHALAAPPARRGRGESAAGGPGGGVERVLRAFADAVQADPAGTEAAEELVAFAVAAGRHREAREGFEELARRRREDPELLVRFGDFLAGPGSDPEGALARYAQALIWRPGDTETRLKMADIHLAATAALLAQQSFAAAEARLRDARRFAVDASSPQAARVRELEARLREIRGR